MRSAATSPIWSLEKNHPPEASAATHADDDDVYRVTSYSPGVQYDKYDTVDWSEPVSRWKNTDSAKQQQVALEKSDKYTTTDFTDDWPQGEGDILKVEPVLPVVRQDGDTMTEPLVTNDASTDVDDLDDPLERLATLETTSSQTHFENKNASVQVFLESPDDELMADLEKSLEEATRWRNLTEELRVENEDLKRTSENLKIEVVDLRVLPDKLKVLEEEKANLEKTLFEMESRMKIVLKDSEEDARFSATKLEKVATDLNQKNMQLDELSSQLDDYKARQSNLERVIQDLKLHLRNANVQFPGTSDQSDVLMKNIEGDMKSSPFIDKESNDILGEKMNSAAKNTSLNSNFDDEGSVDLLRKYNNLRKLAENLQTSVTPLKAKLALANKKSRLRDDLLRRLIQEGNVPLYLKEEVEENLKDREHYRALSPLTLTHINRLEHDLFNHLYDKIPYFGHVDETRVQNAPLSSGDFVYESTTTATAPPPTTTKAKISESSSEKKRHNFDTPAEDLFPDVKSPRVGAPPSSNPPDGRHERPNRDDGLYATKDFHRGQNLTLGNYDKATGRRISRSNAPNKSVPPPQQFRIEDILGIKTILLRWEPAKIDIQSIVGYELKVNGVKRDFIPGALTSKYSSDFPVGQRFPVVFELYSVTPDGNQSAPSTIVVHGLQKVGGTGSTGGGDYTGAATKLGHRRSEPAVAGTPGKRNVYYAFYDYSPTGFTITKEGVTYSELAFKTGNIIEAYGEPMPNGYILGKIAGTSRLGLIPMTFLERFHHR